MSRVLLVDDDAALLEVFAEELPGRGFQVSTATSGEEALARLDAVDPDVVVTDLNMRGLRGTELVRRVVEVRPDVPVIILTGFGDLPSAIDAIRAGAYDYLTKPIEPEPLALSLARAARHRGLQREVERLRTLVGAAGSPGEIIAASEAMRPVLDLLTRVAPTTTTVLVRGESGTGKELIARSLHALSPRAERPFVALNCATIPEPLLESELFGHARGAFTGAVAARRGLFLEASGGTLLLDEVGELPLALQPKLLRALQERTVRAVGGAREEPFDARVVVATNRDLQAEVTAGRFREDLYYRLAVIELEVPPLRVRGHDVLLLAQHFLAKYAARLGRSAPALSVGVAERLLAYGWPGNVRELENAVERAVTLCRGDEVVSGDLPRALLKGAEDQGLLEDPALVPRDDVITWPTIDELERRYIRKVLDAVGGNKTLAARTLGLDRKTLYRKLGRSV
ncbi:MAG: sigma-54-dependent Fis family transcriptional regulator [Planctomycetota bacterium]|nr:sigma-54-dependent Fis family transcriptional regulator [Planctomycetota bacterium]